MYGSTIFTAIVIVVVFALSSWKLKSTEFSIFLAAVAGAIAGGFGFPVRLLVEGWFTYFDVALIFVTASIFINMYTETGAMDALIRKLVENFFNHKWIMMVFMAILMIIPGALTGAGSVSIFVVGGLVTTVLTYMGLSKGKIVGFIYVFAMLAAAAPPINLWAMLMTAQANMPYVGFDVVLIVPIAIIAAFAIIWFGRGSKPKSKKEVLANLPKPVEKMNWVRILTPLLVLVVLILLQKYAAFYIPVLGLPLTFVLSAIAVLLVNPKKTSFKRWMTVISNTMEQVFPLLATVISVGALVNILTGTGVRGLIAITFVTLPLGLIYALALLFTPFAQGSLSYGSAVILGTPIIFLFNNLGFNVTVVTAALSLMFPLGDCLPPSRIVGRLSIEAVQYEGSYMSFLKEIMVPAFFMAAVALIMFIFPNQLSFLVVY
ncbi:MAG TPA: citrate transporter [Thermotogota bacterium]|nr:citrate transporter [Thermotogaceae bacterium]OQC32944.1 MAG: hypothetical protein BWX67_00056 [Thermotogota bacterium ADurb.Bin062]HNW46028.1 citrate transporter [Thermotogota bacterium]HOD91230.1 citrate transporter [Thermotogota bacterium]HOF22765.1 citrate transporter [Thermotogota bacterium]